MLILSRKVNESLIISVPGQEEPIEIVVTELNSGQVRLGIQASRGCKIWRKELFLTEEYNKQAAAAASAAGIRNMASRLTGAAKALAGSEAEKASEEE
ncbi:MAG: carbon storage regulator [Clostridiales bacterium]